MSEPKELFIPCDGINIHAKLTLPEGKEKCPLIILYPGFTGHIEEEHILQAEAGMLDAGAAVLRAEMYGHGKTGGEFKEHTLFKWITNAYYVLNYAETLDFATSISIAGHSQGGLLAILIAGMYHDKIRAGIFLSPALMIPEIARSGEILGVYFDPGKVPDVIDREEGLKLSGNYVRVAQTIYVEKIAPSFRGPALIVHGTTDETVPFRCAEEAKGFYEDVRLVPVEGDTHCFDNHMDEMRKAVEEFVRERVVTE